jgi:D-alanyl-D-alanine carboxypeptidase (penicillin-binding protein 5/6)
MKNKLYIIIVFVLIALICIVKLFELNLSKNGQGNIAEANSTRSNSDNVTIPMIKDFSIAKIPEKKSGVKAPNIYANNYILFEINSKYPLIEKNAHVKVPVASTTKIITAIIALENYKLDDIVEISKNAASQIGSDVYLQTGEKITVNNLLYALLIQSGNDAAMALAENMKDGGLDNFVRKMNEKAKTLGMNDSDFKDPAGLNDAGVSSAFDLAIATAYALNNFGVFRDIIKSTEYNFTSSDLNHRIHDLKTSNRLIESDEPLYMNSAIGVKTGFTPDAGHCLVSAASVNGTMLVGVILHTIEEKNDSSARESKKLLEWGFDNFNF